MHKDYAEITVTDNGRGLTPQVSRNIFKPFNTAKRLGTGLGLYITKQLSEKNGGGISVSSLPAGGLRFLVVLPVDTGRAATGETARSDK